MTRVARVGFFGILGSGNWGNDISLDVLVQALRDRVPEARITFMAMGPRHLEEVYGAPAEWLQWYEGHADRYRFMPAVAAKAVGRLLDVPRTWAWVRRQDLVVVPGAGVFETTTPGRPWSTPLSLLTLSVAGRLSGTRVAYVGVGANVSHDPVIRRELAWAARLATYRSFRDEASRDAMVATGVPAAGDPVHPDLIFAAGLHVRRRTPDRPTVGVGVMKYVGADADRHRADELHAAYVSVMGAFLELLVAEGWRVRLFTGDREDEEVLDRLADRVDGAAGTGHVERCPVRSMDEVLDLVAGVDCVVATRFHNVLGALRVGVPVLSVSYAPKSDHVMAAMGLEDYCHPADGIDLDRLVEQFRDLVAHRDEVAAAMPRRDRRLAEAARRQVERVVGLARQVAGAGEPGDPGDRGRTDGPDTRGGTAGPDVREALTPTGRGAR